MPLGNESIGSCEQCGELFHVRLCSRCRAPDLNIALQMSLRNLLEVIDRELEKSGCDRSDLPQSSQAKIKAATEALGSG